MTNEITSYLGNFLVCSRHNKLVTISDSGETSRELNEIEIMIKGIYFLIDLFEPFRNLIVAKLSK